MAEAKDILLEALRKELRTQMNWHADNMAVGACQDFPEYRYTCGVIHGLAQAEEQLLALDRKQYEGDDD